MGSRGGHRASLLLGWCRCKGPDGRYPQPVESGPALPVLSGSEQDVVFCEVTASIVGLSHSNQKEAKPSELCAF